MDHWHVGNKTGKGHWILGNRMGRGHSNDGNTIGKGTLEHWDEKDRESVNRTLGIGLNVGNRIGKG